MSKKFAVPNFAQALIAKAIGLNPANVAVVHETDALITFLQYLPRKMFLVEKVDGTVIRMEDKCGNQ